MSEAVTKAWVLVRRRPVAQPGVVAIGWFGRLYGRGYRGALLVAFALLGDWVAAERVARDSFVLAHRRRIRIAGSADPDDEVRALVVRLARRRLRWRALRDRLLRRPSAAPSEREAVLRLHDPAGLSTTSIASVMDIPVGVVESYLEDAGPVSWAGVRQPVVTRVLERARWRTTRRRAVAGAAVALLGAAVVVPILQVGPPLSETENETVGSATSPSPRPREVPGVSGVVDLMFADERHGHALRVDCGVLDCALGLVSTADGEHWTGHGVPALHKAAGGRSEGGRLYVLGPAEVAIDLFPTGGLGRVNRVYSADGGQTWARVPLAQRGSVREIPAGAVLVTTCGRSRTRCEVGVVLPGSGRSARLATAPSLYRPFAGVVPLADGRWWVAGMDPRTHEWAIAVSEDDGRTWTVSRLSWRGKASGQDWAMVASGDALIATATDVQTAGPTTIFRSTDGGRTWTKTNDDVPGALEGSAVAASDGTLLINTTDGRGLISRDGGHTFTDVRPRFRGTAYWARTGYVAISTPDAPIQYSPDGLHWQEIQVRR